MNIRWIRPLYATHSHRKNVPKRKRGKRIFKKKKPFYDMFVMGKDCFGKIRVSYES